MQGLVLCSPLQVRIQAGAPAPLPTTKRARAREREGRKYNLQNRMVADLVETVLVFFGVFFVCLFLVFFYIFISHQDL